MHVCFAHAQLACIRHTVVCRRPKKLKTGHHTQVCYLRKLRSSQF